jgi:hypothetical protein
MLFKRFVRMLAIVVGFVGLVACVAGTYAVWSLGSRLDRANEKAFAMIDAGLAATQDRLRGVQERMKDTKHAANEIGQSLRDRGASKAKERLGSGLELESRAEMLTTYLQTADSWLETSVETIRSIQQIVELAISMDGSPDLILLEEVLDSLTSLQSTLQQTERTADGIREFAANKDGESEENRISRITKLVGQMLVTTSEMDARLEEPLIRLARLQVDTRQLKVRISNHILLLTIGGYLVLAWIAAGQAALCSWGWKNRCRSRSAA